MLRPQDHARRAPLLTQQAAGFGSDAEIGLGWSYGCAFGRAKHERVAVLLRDASCDRQPFRERGTLPQSLEQNSGDNRDERDSDESAAD